MATPQSRRTARKAPAFGLALASSNASAQAREVVIFAAASLRNALDGATAAWARTTGRAAVTSYAASNTPARQIDAGVPADPSFSADLKTALHGARLPMGQVDAAPAGKYDKAALERFGAWDRVKDKGAQAKNVRAARLLVSREEAPLGIVYKTDAVSGLNVRIVATFPEGSHPPVIYPVAITRESGEPETASLLDFRRSAGARPFFEEQGFSVLNSAGSGS